MTGAEGRRKFVQALGEALDNKNPVCECTSDPHCKPFTGNWFDIQYEGDDAQCTHAAGSHPQCERVCLMCVWGRSCLRHGLRLMGPGESAGMSAPMRG